VSSQAAHASGFSSSGTTRRPGELLGHPICLFTLFFTEMWERFSFYGMKALLILYMVNYLFWSQKASSTVMMWYAGLVYVTPIFGGLLADKLLGARWSVFFGGILIAIGHFLLAFEPLPFFFSGLGFLIVGVGLLKPNISTQVGSLYRSDDERRDSAFTIFYMGINLGAFLGPIICGWLRINFSWHHGFAAAGVGMVIGLIVYVLGMRSVVRRAAQIAVENAAAGGTGQGESPSDAAKEAVAEASGHVYRDRSIVLVVICVFCILFWVGFEQAANVMNLWADKHTNLHVFRGSSPEVVVDVPATDSTATTQPATVPAQTTTWRDTQIAAEQTQSINPLYILIFAPVFAWLWTFLEKRKRQPSTPMKMALGVFFATMAYGAMLAAAASENKPTSAPLAALPDEFFVDEEGRVYSVDTQDDGTEERIDYGATRLCWENGTLHLNGVLPDLDWMRALGASSSDAYRRVVEELVEKAEQRAEEVREAKRKKETSKDATWEVQVTLPPGEPDLTPIAGWPAEEEVKKDVEKTRGDSLWSTIKRLFSAKGKVQVPKVRWDAETRTLSASATLSEKDRAQILANGAEPQFRDALTSIYRQSSVLRVSIGWLLLFYLLLTIGELCLSPVGLSLVTKAAPPKYVGLFMGFWFFTTGGVSNWVAHFMGSYWGTMTPTAYFLIFGCVAAAATVIMLLLLRVLKPMLHGLR
jgi:POT family proton-dependent oligopeptide transporter